MNPIKPYRNMAVAATAILIALVVLALALAGRADAQVAPDCTVLLAEAVRNTQSSLDSHQLLVWQAQGWPEAYWPEAWAAYNRWVSDPVSLIPYDGQPWHTEWARRYAVTLRALREC